MLHALITGERINKGRTEGEALVMAATKPVPSVARIAPDLPVEVVALVDKALAWDKRNRYAGAREMQSAVLAALARVAPQELPRIAAPVGAVEALHTPSRSAAPQAAPLFEPEPVQESAVPEGPAPIDETDARVVGSRTLRAGRSAAAGRAPVRLGPPSTERSLRTTFERFVIPRGRPDHRVPGASMLFRSSGTRSGAAEHRDSSRITVRAASADEAAAGALGDLRTFLSILMRTDRTSRTTSRRPSGRRAFP
jgi:hypothetical protein